MKHIYLRNLLTALLLLCSTVVVNAQTFNPWVSTNKSNNSTSETSYVFNVVSGDELTFDWKVSSEQNYDWLTITLNDEQLVRASGENSGSFSRTFTTNGQMTLLVKYTKDVSQYKGSDYGEIYNIKLTSSAAPIVGTCGDNLSWELKNGTLTISGSGEMCKMSVLDYPWFEHKDNIQRIVIENGVTSIPESAFDSYYSALTSVSIANSVKFIGKYAFFCCSNLSTIDIPEGLEEMGYGSFFQTAWHTNLPENEDIYLGKVYYCRKGYNYPETLTIKEGTTCIAGGALAQCRAEEVVIPGSVKSIGFQAFTQSSMKKVTFAEGLQRIDYQAFYQCINLEEINLPTSLTTIGNYAFAGCVNLEEINLPTSLTTIGDCAFAGCRNITSVEIPANVTSIGFEAISGVNIETIKVATENAVYDSRNNSNAIIETATNKLVVGFKTTVIPESVTAIEQYAFDGCGGYSYYSGLQSIEIPSSVTSIGEYAFRGCGDLKQVHISDLAAWCDIKFGNAEANPLYNARNLYVNGENVTKLIIPEGVTEIKNCAFYNCTGITEVVIPESVTSIGYDAFRGCENLANVEIRGAVESIGDGAFTGTAWYNNQPDGVVYAGKVLYKYKGTMPAGTSITVKDGTLSIGGSAFDGCTGLTSIDIPASVTSIERYTFYGCTGLTNLLIPEGVTEIKESAFYNCSNIEQVVIPNSVTTIGDAAFGNCYKIKTVYNLSQLEFVKGSEDFGGVAANATTVNNYVQQANSIYKLYGDYIFWTYKRYINGSYQMHSEIKAYVGNSLDVVLPESYNGKAYDLGAAFRATKIKSIVIPESFTSIEGSAFYNCSSLASVEIPVSVTSIGSSAFYGCSSLANIEIPASVTSVGENAFYNTAWYNNQPDGVIYAGKVLYKYKGTMPENTSITIKDGTLSIGILAFSECFGLVNIEIPASVTTIESSAFYNTGLTSVVIPASVKTIGGNAFENCHSLTSVVIPEGVTTIGGSAFRQCIKLKEIEIPGSVTSIEPYTFQACLALTNVKIGDGVKSIGNVAFVICEALTKIEIPNSVTSIGGEAFYGCNSLKNIVIGSGVTSLEDAFNYCKNLESIVIAEDNTVYDSRENCNAIIETATNTLLKGCKNTVIPDGVTSISYNAFYECAGLTSIEIPASVTAIELYTFYGCTGLTSVISRISAEDLFELDYDYVFNGVDKTTCTLYVPYGAKETYAATRGWSEFTNIVELDPTEVTITINQYGCATYCSEFTLDFSNVEGLKAYAATGYKSNSKVVILTKVQTAEGGVGLFLKGEPGEYVVPIIESTDEHSLNMLVGTLEPTIVNGTEGGMTNFKFTIKSGDETPMFYQFDDNSTLSAGKAYLQIPTAWLPSTAQKSVSITFDEGETTDIDELKGDNGEQKTVYDLQGRVVENPTSGIYIIDGKKVIIK